MPRSTTATAAPNTDDHANLVTATQVGRNFGRFCDEALRHPVTVERHGAPRIVMLSLHEYRRLRALEPRAFHPSELNDEDYAALGRSREKLATRAGVGA